MRNWPDKITTPFEKEIINELKKSYSNLDTIMTDLANRLNEFSPNAQNEILSMVEGYDIGMVVGFFGHLGMYFNQLPADTQDRVLNYLENHQMYTRRFTSLILYCYDKLPAKTRKRIDAINKKVIQDLLKEGRIKKVKFRT